MQTADERLALCGLLRPNASADHCGSSGGELTREADNGIGSNATNLGHPIRRPGGELAGEVIKVGAGPARKLKVCETLLEHHAPHAGGEDGVRTGTKLDVFVALLGGASADRVDADDARAMSIARLLHEVPVVMACREHVDAPEKDEAALRHLLRVEAKRQSFPFNGHRRNGARSTRLTARAKCMEQTHRRAHLHNPHRAHVAVRQQRFRTMFVNDGGESSAITSIAVFHETRSNCPAPFGPTRRSGCSRRSGA